MICCTIFIVLGCLTAYSSSTAISASGRSSSSRSNNGKTNFNDNGILRDGDTSNQDLSPELAVKSHKKQIKGIGFNAHSPNNNNKNNVNDNDGYSLDDIANNDSMNFNGFDENEADNEANDFISIEIDDQLSLKDQMRLLTQQMTKRFQHELKAAARKMSKDLFKIDFQAQFDQLR